MIRVKVNTTDKSLPKEISQMEAVVLSKRLNHNISVSSGRKRPRNPREIETLLCWEKERGGKKIGNI